MGFGDDYDLFARIVAEGSLSAAARSLLISPAMVSKRLARLEARLGSRLIRRTTRRLYLTEAGRTFHDEVVAILARAKAAEERLSGRALAPAGSLRLSAPTSFGRQHVAPLIAPFLSDYPEVEIDLELSDDFTDLLAERIDLAIRITDRIGGAEQAERLAASNRVLCATPGYLTAYGAPGDTSALAGHRLLAARGQLPWRLIGPDGDVAVNGRSLVATNSSEVVRELVLAGAGIALRSLWDIGPDLAAGRVVRVLSDHGGSTDVAIYAVQPRTPIVPAAASAFVDRLRTAFQPVPPWERR